MADYDYDAIVIGSGISGGWAAKELTEKGLKTLLLERGRNIEHITGYTNATKDPWQIPDRGKGPTALKENYPVLKRAHMIDEANIDYWTNEKESPYSETRPFNWLRGYHVGGRSLMWGRQSYRWSDFDFEANGKEGVAVDWPIRYRDIAPWYDYVEKHAGISGSREGMAQLPDGQFLPPMEMNVVEKSVAAAIKRKYQDRRRMIIGRVANITVPFPNRPGCQYRDKCWLGCPFGGYFSTQSSTLPYAVATGNLTLRPFSIARQVTYDKDTRKATGVEVVDAESGQTYRYTAKIVFLCASTFNSTWILMNSATDIWPDGLGSSSGELGHNVLDHHIRAGASGQFEEFGDRTVFGRRANGIYIPRYRNLFGDKRNYLRGFGYQGSASRSGWTRAVAELSIGAELKSTLTQPGPWSMGMSGFGEILPRHENRMSLDPVKKDKWGMPVIAFDCKLSDNERAMRQDIMHDAAEMLEAGGAKNVHTSDGDYLFGEAIHEMGTARMGHDPKTSVVNRHNQVWDAKNVFMTDGAFMASSGCVNPSLTYMAMTARAADFAVGELKKGNL